MGQGPGRIVPNPGPSLKGFDVGRELTDYGTDRLAKLFEVAGEFPAHVGPGVDLAGHENTDRPALSAAGRPYHIHRTSGREKIRPAWRHRNQNEIGNIHSSLSGALKVRWTVHDDREVFGLLQDFLLPALRPAGVFERQGPNLYGQFVIFRPCEGRSLLVRIHQQDVAAPAEGTG